MTKTLVGSIILAFALLCATGLASEKDRNSKSNKSSSNNATASEGEKRFQTHCGRCHNPPEELSPSSAPAVLRHMRVRAMLSKEDETLIMQYIAPR